MKGYSLVFLVLLASITITHVATPHRNSKYTISGPVVSGQDLVNATRQGGAIEKIAIIKNGGEAQNSATNQATFDCLLQDKK